MTVVAHPGGAARDRRLGSRAPGAEPAPIRTLGRRGEDLAAAYLEQQGLAVLSRNWRCRDGELDLVATDGERIIVCEVKTRAGEGYGGPAEAVTAAKVSRIRRLAMSWLAAHRVGWCEVRFDVIAVLLPLCGRAVVQHLPGAF
jgi:putative endonuclease